MNTSLKRYTQSGIYIQLLLVVLMSGCTQDIELDLPTADEVLVVEGSIEQGSPALLMLTRNLPFSEASDFVTQDDLIIKDAIITVSDGTNTDVMEQIPEGLIFGGTGMYWTTNMFGEIGKTYHLTIEYEGTVLTAQTTIPKPVSVDTLWFQTEQNFHDIGFVWTTLHDPDTLGNYYKFFAKNTQDWFFSKPFGTTFEDKFFNGQSFDVFFDRNEEVLFDETGMFQVGDTAVLKLTSIDQKTFKFWRTYEAEKNQRNNPFLEAPEISSNISGGLGLWAGYGAYYDTLIIR